GYTETMAPLVVGDWVIIGTSGAEYGIRGYVKSFNAATGAAGWTWYTLPSPEEGGWWGPFSKTTPDGDDLKRDIAKERADSAKYADAWKTGGGSMWMTPAYDPDTKSPYVAIGNPSPHTGGVITPGAQRRRQPLARIDRGDRRDQRQVQVGLPGSPARRVGPGRGEPAGDRHGR